MPVPLEEPPLSSWLLGQDFPTGGKKMLNSSLLVILAPQHCTIVCVSHVRVGEGEQTLLVLWK